MKSSTWCEICRGSMPQHGLEDVAEPIFCRGCEKRLPPSLLKAITDKPFSYALKLRTGEIIEFSGAEINGDFAHLEQFGGGEFIVSALENMPFERGIDVRVSEIVWCADCPRGS